MSVSKAPAPARMTAQSIAAMMAGSNMKCLFDREEETAHGSSGNSRHIREGRNRVLVKLVRTAGLEPAHPFRIADFKSSPAIIPAIPHATPTQL